MIILNIINDYFVYLFLIIKTYEIKVFDIFNYHKKVYKCKILS